MAHSLALIMRVLLAHPGTQHAFRLARELDARGLLGEFWTGLALRKGGLADRLVSGRRPLPGLGGLRSRVARGITAARLHTVPVNEFRFLLRLKLGASSVATLHARNRAFQAAIPDENLRRHQAVIAFDTSAWLLASRTQALGVPLYLDRSIAHPAQLARLQENLQRQHPAWFPAGEPRPDYLAEAEDTEHRLAKTIVVGSSFARDSLVAEGIAADKIAVNPYGVDWARFQAAPPETGAPARPLRFVFLGSLIGRKGVPFLLDAWRALAARRGDTELWLVGPCAPAERRLIPELPGLVVTGRIPHAEVPALLAQSDVFVLPSLLEGFSLAMIEAVAVGLPMIATPNTGAADILLDPSLGRLVPPGSSEALAAAMAEFLQRPPDRAEVTRASTTLRERFSWTAYAQRWEHLLTAP